MTDKVSRIIEELEVTGDEVALALANNFKDLDEQQQEDVVSSLKHLYNILKQLPSLE